MKTKTAILSNSALIIIAAALLTLSGCLKDNNTYKYSKGIFPDTVVNLADINSAFDDYNTSTSQISGAVPMIFSSNRKTAGFQFDIEQALLVFKFDKNDGRFELTEEMMSDPFFTSLINKAVTSKNDFGPYRLYNTFDGMEYTMLASENEAGNLDLRYLYNLPYYGSSIPEILGPYPVKTLNSEFDDAYISFDLNLDSAYYNSNATGNFDIYVRSRSLSQNLDQWFNTDYSAGTPVSSLNSPMDDKCPMVYNKLMVFTSNREGGYGGYDLYYSVFRNGNWGEPVNFGPRINTQYDEYRPLAGFHEEFKNLYFIFSSNRPGGAGGFDLYFTGIDNPAE